MGSPPGRAGPTQRPRPLNPAALASAQSIFHESRQAAAQEGSVFKSDLTGYSEHPTIPNSLPEAHLPFETAPLQSRQPSRAGGLRVPSRLQATVSTQQLSTTGLVPLEELL